MTDSMLVLSPFLALPYHPLHPIPLPLTVWPPIALAPTKLTIQQKRKQTKIVEHSKRERARETDKPCSLAPTFCIGDLAGCIELVALRHLAPALPRPASLPTLSCCSLCSQLLFACYLVPPLHPTLLLLLLLALALLCFGQQPLRRRRWQRRRLRQRHRHRNRHRCCCVDDFFSQFSVLFLVRFVVISLLCFSFFLFVFSFLYTFFFLFYMLRPMRCYRLYKRNPCGDVGKWRIQMCSPLYFSFMRVFSYESALETMG